jgi:pyruvate dehydrogenase E2 component (dihydrolipoamide acetyltransferase)
MADIEMPQLGETVTEGTIIRWFKQVGEQVEIDEVLFEVSTDKVDSEVPSPVSGVLTEIRVPEGETVDVGTVLAVVGDGAAPAAEAAPAAAQAAPAAEAAPAAAQAAPAAPAAAQETAPAAAAPAQAVPGEAAPEAAPEEEPAPAPAAEPAEAAPAAEAAPEAAEEEAPAPAGGGDGEGLDGRLLSPVVRRLIREHELDPDGITGTGMGGRITRKDVLDAIDRQQAGAPRAAAEAASPAPEAPAAPAPAAQAPAAQAPAVSAPAARVPAAQAPAAPAVPTAAGRSDWVAFSNIRRRTAEHMLHSKSVAPHAMTVAEVDYEAVEVARRAAKDTFRAEEGFGLTYLPFIARAVIDALGDWPNLNASVEGEGLRVYRDINLGIAVDLDFEGLIVPVIRQADGKRLRALAREIDDLASRARSKKLGVDEITGGTFTISNNGSFGTFATEAIINQPQVAVLSTDGVTRKPVVVTDQHGNESIAIHSVGLLAMSWDHRAFDGSYAGAFLRDVKQIIETRDWSVEL